MLQIYKLIKLQIIELTLSTPYKMNSQFQTYLSLKHPSPNPFILKLSANSLSVQQNFLSLQCYLLKKLSLILPSQITQQNKQIVQLYKTVLIQVIQSQLIDWGNKEVMEEIGGFLEGWQLGMSKHVSWLHTRTCFFFIEDKLKKAKHYHSLDFIRLKRAKLQPNKKQFLDQIMGQNVISNQLKSYIKQLQQLSMLKHQTPNKQAPINQPIFPTPHSKSPSNPQQSLSSILSSKQILFNDTQQSWITLQSLFKYLPVIQTNNKSLRTEIYQLLEVYVQEVLVTFIHKQQIRNNLTTEIDIRYNVVRKFGDQYLIRRFNQICKKLLNRQNNY